MLKAENNRGWALWAAAAVLVGAVTLQAVRIRDVQRGDVTTPARPIGLAEKVPLEVAGWSGRDEPLGATEAVQTAVERNLNYDDVVNRIYRSRGGASFGVYVAYWSAGRMPMEKVASHTPDRCWTENGWRCTARRFPEALSAGGRALKPAYWRTFVSPAGGTPQHVVYWHLVGDELYDYGGGFNQRPGIVRWWRDMLHYAFAGSREQFFVRLTSDRPFEAIGRDPGFQEVLGSLMKLGLAEKAGSAGQ